MSATTLQNMTRAEREALFLKAQAARGGKTSSVRPAGIPPRDAARDFWPLSYAQRRLWFIAHMWPAAHNLPVGLRLIGALDEVALQASIDRIVQRHESLRTRFDVVDEQPVQRIADTDGCPLMRHDPFGAGEDAEEAVEHWRRIESATPFDIAQGPLIRGRLLRLGERDHVLLLTMHHIVSDGWSLGVLAGELGELYRAYAMEGLASDIDPLPRLAVQYADYAVWQRDWLSGDVRQRQLDFWRKELAGTPARTLLPTDRPRPPVQDHRGQSVSVTFDRMLAAGLKALSQRHGTTLYMTLLAAWGALVARLSGQDEVVIGSPVANRTRTEVEPLIGFFVNTLALRLDVSDRPSVAQWLSQVRDRVLQAQTHQDLPFEQVVEALQPQRTLAHSPIFQLTFAWQNTPDDALALGDVALHCLPPHTGEHVAQYDLTLELREAEEGIVGTLVYASALYEPATMHRHIAYLEAMLRGMVCDDTQAMDAIAILDDAGRRQVLDTWNDTDRTYARDTFVHRLFEEQVERTPDAIAVEHDDARLTFRALDEAANRLAHHLRSLGVTHEERVAVCLPRGSDLVLAMLATLKAGGAYVPLDPAHPSERWRDTLQDSTPRVVLTHATFAASGHLAGSGTTLSLDAAEQPWESAPVTPVDGGPDARTDRLAYVTYTSGSTGRPNGVMVEHRQLANLIAWHTGRFPLSPGERTSSTAGVAFDACTWEVWPALCSGATLVLPPASTSADPAALLDWWEAQDLKTSFLVTALADVALTRGQSERRSLRHLLTGGDRLARLPEADLPFELVNNYGPTETTVVATSGTLRHDDAVVHIGRPIPNTRVYLLDRLGQPVPQGTPGEIHIGGAQVARGYLNRPDLTRARFLSDPFATEPNARMYKTGDLGRWLPDGTIEYLGRNDQQVKIRGQRIELGEIEAQLSLQPTVREVAVLACEDVPGERRLVAYIVPTDGERPDAQGLRDALAPVLPGYMIPAAYVMLDALPFTPNGKLDRRALPMPDDSAFAQRAYETPQGEVETTLARIWSDLLDVDRVGRQDNFFELGGHSLMAMQMTSRLRQRFGLDVAVSQVFTHPVLHDLARALGSSRADSLPALVATDRPDALPLSFAQQRLWFIAQMGDTASTTYHVPGGMRLHGPLDEAALHAALDRIVQRHEALRTHFDVVDVEPVQRIVDDARFALVRHDVSAGDPEVAVEHWRRVEAEAPFDLARGPLIRGRLLRLGEQEHVLLLTMHHIVSDGWSLGVLTSELGDLYRAYATERLSPDIDPLPSLPLQYADYAIWQRRSLTGDVQRRHLDFWVGQLASAPALVGLATDKPRPPVQDHTGQSLPVVFDEELTAGLKALSQRHGTTLYMTFLAAWGALVARLSGQDEVVIGSPVANRTRAEVEPLIGFFVNTLALRIDLGDRPSVAELLGRVRASVVDAQNHQDLPFEQVVEAIKPRRTLAHSPIFQLMFAWQGAERTSFELSGLDLEELTESSTAAKFDLTLELREEERGIVGSVCFATALYEPATIRCHIAYLEAMLRGMVRDDTQVVDAIAILDDAERFQLLDAWNDTGRAYARDGYVHELFERQALRTPDAIAVEGEEASLTYRALDDAANRLAHHLRSLGVVHEERVALCLPRGTDLVLAMLATLKAGGAYVPLDPAHPPERWLDTLHDSTPRVVLTHAALAASGHLENEGATLALDAQRPWESMPAAKIIDDHHPAMDLLAYIIYTSGSTGRPNGVMVEHRQLANLIGWHSERFPLSPGERTSSTAGVAFDACTWEVWPALCSGATLVLPPASTAGDPVALLDWWEAQDLRTSFLVTALADAALSRGQGRRQGLRQLLTGGDRLGRLPEADLPFELVNNYGPTEATVVATSGTLHHDDVVVHIGRPIANARVYLLDRHGQPVPRGTPGEIHIGGAQVARGYLNRPDLTRARFLPDPFARTSNARMYKTGDLGRWLPDGTIEYLGRNDQQVKIRGLRIEPGEIESQLLLQAAVREVAVLAREDVPGEHRLVAYVVAVEGHVPHAQELRDALAHVLPGYMIPAAYVLMDALPFTPNGKLDRRALPAPDDSAFAQRAYEAPQGEVEIALAQIWSELLHVERVGRRDNFFDLGGHSLLLTRMLDVARRRGLVMDLRQVFDSPTLAALAAVALRDRHAGVAHTLVPLRTTGSQPPLFCFHEGFGSVLVYERLARFIDDDVPVYSVEASALHEYPPVYRPLVDMARDYLDRMVVVQPVGPYRLTGWSGGGLVAYEVARQLLERGESVEFLGMIDTYNVDAEDLEGDIAQAKHYLIRILEYTRPDLTPEVLRALLGLDELEAMVDECHRNRWLRADVTAEEMRRRFQVANDIGRACADYQARALPLDIDLFSAEKPIRKDRSNGWYALLAESLNIIELEGTHMSIMQDETSIARVAGVMNRALLGIRDAERWRARVALTGDRA